MASMTVSEADTAVTESVQKMGCSAPSSRMPLSATRYSVLASIAFCNATTSDVDRRDRTTIWKMDTGLSWKFPVRLYRTVPE